MALALRAYDGPSLPEDAETVTAGRAGWGYSDLSDDEDLLADEASGGGQRVLEAGSGAGGGQSQGSPHQALKGPQETCPGKWCLKRWAETWVCPEPWPQ